MIQVIMYLDSKRKQVTGFHTYGHAEYAEAGTDIVCSAVSAIVLTTVNSIEALTEDVFTVTQNQEQGEIDLQFQAQASKEAVLLLRAMQIGLKGISNEYGEKYLKVTTKEV